MNTTEPRLLRVEVVADLPVLWATLERLDLPATLDRLFPTPRNWRGPLSPGEAGRTIQTLPLNPSYQAYLIAGHAAQIIGVPVKVVYADGATIDADADLNSLRSLSSRKIE